MSSLRPRVTTWRNCFSTGLSQRRGTRSIRTVVFHQCDYISNEMIFRQITRELHALTTLSPHSIGNFGLYVFLTRGCLPSLTVVRPPCLVRRYIPLPLRLDIFLPTRRAKLTHGSDQHQINAGTCTPVAHRPWFESLRGDYVEGRDTVVITSRPRQ